MTKPRFKIDYRPGYSYAIVGLFFRNIGWLGESWREVDSFPTIQAAKDRYEAIKDLPEYLP